MSSYSSPRVSLTSPFKSLVSAGEKGESRGPEKTEGHTQFRRKSEILPDIACAPIICFCHLSWSWVWQRPQQFLSRFSKTHPVLFVETYCSPVDSPAVKLKHQENFPNVVVAEVHLPEARWSDGSYIDQQRRFSLQTLLDDELRVRFDRPILWFNDPMCVTAFAGHLNERLIVYDCMDELSQFKGAPPELLARELTLLRKADVVFCGGRKMRDKRLSENANSHFYGTGVDIQHFGRALAPEQPLAPELAPLKGPVLGYFGVVDERLDYELIAKLADARSDWNIVMVGPTAKVDPRDFPRRSNLHWLGGRPYEALPSFTKGFSVCLMPFAINAATEYINPTKALEYMASGRPVVSTAINEVKTNFSSVSRVAKSHNEFISHCIRESERPSPGRVAAGLKLASDNTWEAIVTKMETHIAAADEARKKQSARADSTEQKASNAYPSAEFAYV